MRSSVRAFLLMLIFAVPSYAYRTSAWVPAWDSSATTIMQQHAGNLTETNPDWYYAAPDGSVTVSSSGVDSRLRAALAGTEIVPTIMNYRNGGFDGAMMATLLSTAANREKHAEAIAQLVVTNAFDGIDIDYEAMPLSARASYTAFVQLLAAKLHASGKTLSITVSAKTSDKQTWDGPGAQDWNAIGAAADRVKIMAYDYHWATSGPGPIAPLDWLRAVARYAAEALPANKAIMGLPWYGYDWLGSNGKGVTFAEAMSRAQSAGITPARDAHGELTYTYGGRTVYFQDATSYRTKVDAVLAANPGIGGFAHWRVGAEDPATWDVVGSLTHNGSTPAEPPAKDFAVVGSNAMTVTAGEEAKAAFTYVGINGFTNEVTVTVRQVDAFPGTFAMVPGVMSSTEAAVLAVWPSRKAAAGTYRFELTARSGALVHVHIVNVSVTAAPSTGKRRSVR